MTAIFKKELQAFFNSATGYLILLLFLVLNGLFLWVFRQESNIFDYGFADLSPFFLLMPWVFLFLVPAITMRSFSEEKKLGTLELLLIKPISIPKMVLGKFLSALAIGVFALLPTIIYVFAIGDLGQITNNYDLGVVLGAYFGTLFLLGLYCSIGLFTSSLSDNQIFAFVLGAALCFLCLYGPEALATLFTDGNTQEWIKNFGAKAHFEDISKGIIDSRNLIYFISLCAFFLYLASNQLAKKQHTPTKKVSKMALGLLALLLVNGLSSLGYHRFDLTEDQRFTLSKEALNTTTGFTAPVTVDILLAGKLPSEFAQLQTETLLLLEQFKQGNPNIIFNLVNPLEEAKSREETIAGLQQLGLKPAAVTIEEDGKTTQELLFPWAMVNHQNKTVKVPLLKNKLGANAQARINNSVQNLEYAFADAFKQLQLQEKKKIAVLKGNGQMADQYLADLLTNLKAYYNIGAITLDSVATNAPKVLAQLSGYDLALVAKPTQTFTEEEKYVLDQYIIGGGKSLWLIDQVRMELDSLFNETGSNVALRRELNLTDFFFKHGVRINPVLVRDLYNTPIVLANGEANDSQYNPLPWAYHPMVFSKENHPINTNIEALKLQFANAIDTLANANRKTILLKSSPLSKTDGVPKPIGFDQLQNLNDKEAYPPGAGFNLAVLVEGAFGSVYQNRVKPLNLSGALDQGKANKMIVIADGDLAKNQIQRGRPLELGYDKWTNSFYGNKEFLINCVNYLLDDNGLINIRSKKVAIPLLDQEKIVASRSKWQILSIGLPVVLILAFALVNAYLRKRKFST